MIPQHLATRPEWICRACGQPCPCPQARVRLAAVHQETGKLGRIGYEMLELAAKELPDTPVAELWDRFVAWTEPVRQP
ncbi:MAG: hypothetical protein GEV12_10100 [Micromonosporaceae bacterium]|nr:hypothetical protein [Micromonosporaceae bacterium]